MRAHRSRLSIATCSSRGSRSIFAAASRAIASIRRSMCGCPTPWTFGFGLLIFGSSVRACVRAACAFPSAPSPGAFRARQPPGRAPVHRWHSTR